MPKDLDIENPNMGFAFEPTTGWEDRDAFVWPPTVGLNLADLTIMSEDDVEAIRARWMAEGTVAATSPLNQHTFTVRPTAKPGLFLVQIQLAGGRDDVTLNDLSASSIVDIWERYFRDGKRSLRNFGLRASRGRVAARAETRTSEGSPQPGLRVGVALSVGDIPSVEAAKVGTRF
ncbi:MAG: hypothetical protein ABI672_21470 [Vicinamibacteria bacterium]